MSQPTESACPTRQQLDELEALMQRMLALPVSDGEEPLPPPAATETKPAPRLRTLPSLPPWVDPAPVSTVPAAPDEHQGPAAAPRPTLVPARPAVPPPPPPVAASEPVHDEQYAAAPPPAEAAAPALAEPPAPTWSAPRPRVKPRPRPPVSSGPRLGWWLWPLLWSNRAFDRCTVHLGRTGRWLRGSRGRNWIGWLGLGLLSIAAAWTLLDWLGWIW